MKNLSPNKRTSVSALQTKGSITLEASVVISFFFLAMVCLVYLFEMIAIQTTVRNAMHAVGRKLAVELYQMPMLSTDAIEKELVAHIGSERMERSMIVSGSNGIDCSRSKKRWNTTIVDLSAVYRLEIPVLMFRIPIIEREETLRIKGWTGDEGGMDLFSSEDVVYLTEHGIVYHADPNCTYLDSSVQGVLPERVAELRNADGEKYRACAYCRGVAARGVVYITEYGNRYHNSAACSRLKRKVYEIPRREVYGIGGCSKCVK